VAGLNFKHMIAEGGVPAQQQKAIARSEMLYNAIKNSDGYYVNNIDPKYRSRINVLFTIGQHENGYTDLEKKFFAESTVLGL
jgi:phosphoserine aminotransferase